MKKTTYIIMALIAVCLAGSFFLPAAIFTSKIPQAIKITNTHDIVEMNLGNFYELTVENDESYSISCEDPSVPLTLRIVSDDTISQPKLYLDKSWEDNVNYYIEDNKLYFSVDLHSLKEKGIEPSHDSLTATADNCLVGELVVPRGYLYHIEPRHLYLDMNGFHEEKMQIAYAFAGINMTDCDIPHLVIVH